MRNAHTIHGAASVLRSVNGRLVAPTLADPHFAKKVEEAASSLFPSREAAIRHFQKRGVMTPKGNLTKAYGG